MGAGGVCVIYGLCGVCGVSVWCVGVRGTYGGVYVGSVRGGGVCVAPCGGMWEVLGEFMGCVGHCGGDVGGLG